MTGINVPVRIGGVTVMPGDLVVGDREGVYFIPPQFVEAVLDHADETHIHHEWASRNSMKGNASLQRSMAHRRILSCGRNIGSIRKLLSEIHKQQSSQ